VKKLQENTNNNVTNVLVKHQNHFIGCCQKEAHNWKEVLDRKTEFESMYWMYCFKYTSFIMGVLFCSLKNSTFSWLHFSTIFIICFTLSCLTNLFSFDFVKTFNSCVHQVVWVIAKINKENLTPSICQLFSFGLKFSFC
jgi:hypothetical protein